MILSIYKQGARSADTHLPTLSAIEFIVHLFGMLVSDDTFDAIGNGADGGCSPTTIWLFMLKVSVSALSIDCFGVTLVGD